MTNTEKEQILALKVQGLGCNRISKLTGVPLGTVKSFLSRADIKPPEASKGVCLECGSEIENTPHKKINVSAPGSVAKSGGMPICTW